MSITVASPFRLLYSYIFVICIDRWTGCDAHSGRGIGQVRSFDTPPQILPDNYRFAFYYEAQVGPVRGTIIDHPAAAAASNDRHYGTIVTCDKQRISYALLI